MDIGHPDGATHDTRKMSDVRNLFDSFVSPDVPHEVVIGEDEAIDPHLSLLGNQPPVGIQLLPPAPEIRFIRRKSPFPPDIALPFDLETMEGHPFDLPKAGAVIVPSEDLGP